MLLSDWEWTCVCCGEQKRGLPDLSYATPIHAEWAETDDSFRVIEQTSDLCRIEIDGAPFFFVRAILELPIAGAEGRFGFGVWSTLSKANYDRYAETYGDDQADLGRMTGYLANRLPGYPDTVNLKLWLDPQGHNQRPKATAMTDQDHLIVRDQSQGIEIDRLVAIVAPAMPCRGEG